MRFLDVIRQKSLQAAFVRHSAGSFRVVRAGFLTAGSGR